MEWTFFLFMKVPVAYGFPHLFIYGNFTKFVDGITLFLFWDLKLVNQQIEWSDRG